MEVITAKQIWSIILILILVIAGAAAAILLISGPAPTPISTFENKVVISEIYYWGGVDNEFVELYIRENVSTNLLNWYITTYDDDKGTLPAISGLEQFCYVVVRPGLGTDDLDASDGTATVYLNLLAPILDDSGDEVGLYDAQGTLVDFVRYGGGNGDPVLGDWPPDDSGAVADSGESIQIQGDDQDNSGNWMSGPPSEGEANIYEFMYDNVLIQIHNGINFIPSPAEVEGKVKVENTGPGVVPADLAKIEEYAKFSLSFFENNGFDGVQLGPDNKLDIYVAQGNENEATGKTTYYSDNKDVIIRIWLGKIRSNIDEKYVVEHELMHAIQNKVNKDNEGKEYRRKGSSADQWWNEGMAVYWGIESVKAQENIDDKAVQDEFKRVGDHNVYDHFLDNLNRNIIDDWGGTYHDYVGVYLFIKFIRENYGENKLKEIHERIRNRGGWARDENDKLPPEVLEEVLGKSIDQIVREWIEWLWLVAPETNKTPRPSSTVTPLSENVALNPWGSRINVIKIENEDPFKIHIYGTHENDRFWITKLKYKKDNTIEREPPHQVYGGHYAPQLILNPGDYDNIVIIKTRVDSYGTGTLRIEIAPIVDNTPPTIENKQPSPGSAVTDNTPTIGANYSDPSGVDLESLKIFVDNVNVTDQATVTSTGVTYTPTTGLADGEHTVEVWVGDNISNKAKENWSFTVETRKKWALLVGSANDLSDKTTLEKVGIEDEVPNTSFEDWNIEGTKPDCWDNQTLIPSIYWMSTTDPHTGDWAALMELYPGADGFWYLLSDWRVPVVPNAQYTASAYTKMVWFDENNPPIAYVGILWYDNTGSPIENVWSSGVSGVPDWTLETLTTMSPSTAASAEIRLRGKNPSPSEMCWVLFDTVKMSHYEYVDNPSTLENQDAFPAQTLQAYWALKNNGYDDDHIVLMLYHTGDSFISIDDNTVNALTGAAVDVEDDDVTKGRLENEIRDLAAAVENDDEVLIYLVDHGSYDNNAYFHFETGDNISGQELDNWLDQITCARMTVLVDSCYSGDFITSPLSQSGRILVSACGPPDDNLAKYWTGVSPSENIPFAGSWFFHPFWENIAAGDSIGTAYSNACNYIPTQSGTYAGMTVNSIQSPRLLDNVGDAGAYSFL